MLLVIDANIVISSLIKDSKTREIIMSGKFSFVSPDYLLDEIYKYKDYIKQKANLAESDIDTLIWIVLKRVTIVPYDRYRLRIAEASRIMSNDTKDVPYVACYLQEKCDAIWTNDSDYLGKPEINIIGSNYLLELL